MEPVASSLAISSNPLLAHGKRLADMTKARVELAWNRSQGEALMLDALNSSEPARSEAEAALLGKLLKPMNEHFRVFQKRTHKAANSPEAWHNAEAFSMGVVLLGMLVCGFTVCWQDVENITMKSHRKQSLRRGVPLPPRDSPSRRTSESAGAQSTFGHMLMSGNATA